MTPDLQSSLLCDDVRQEHNGKFMLIGLFDVIAVPSFPTVFHRMCIVNRWCCGEGSFHQQSRIVMPQGDKVLIEGKAVPFALSDTEAISTCVEIFLNVRFETAGTYWIEILLDGDMKVRYPLKAGVIKRAPQPPEN